jgi:hypothetical protein
MAKIDAFFKLMNDQGASDLHLAAGQPPALRIRGDVERVKYKVLDNESLRAMLYEIAPEDKVKVFEETGDVDFGYEIPGLARYRANFFMQKNGVGAVFREIPSTIMTAEELGLPPVIPSWLPFRGDWYWLPAQPGAANQQLWLLLSMWPTEREKTISSPLKIPLNLFIKARGVLSITGKSVSIPNHFIPPCVVPFARTLISYLLVN